MILWSVDTLDWQSRNAAAVRAVVNRDTRNGSIVLMHDIHSTTVDAVPGIVDDLQGQGYTLVTVSELLGSPGARPGLHPTLNPARARPARRVPPPRAGRAGPVVVPGSVSGK